GVQDYQKLIIRERPVNANKYLRSETHIQLEVVCPASDRYHGVGGFDTCCVREVPMSKVTIDEILRSRLNGLNEELELCDESGRTLGHFLPPDIYRTFLYAYVESQCPYTQEELQRRRQETG